MRRTRGQVGRPAPWSARSTKSPRRGRGTVRGTPVRRLRISSLTEAAIRAGFSKLRDAAEFDKLYEAGKISYMRTDSVNLSQDALEAAKAEITRAYGPEYAQPRVYKTKSASAQEAHEAIRPTDFALVKAGSDSQEQRL